jgi:DNA-binding CsgD family transcriptional regulator
MENDFIDVHIRVEITEDDKRYVQLLANGYTVYKIASKLSINRRTMEMKLVRLKEKVNAKNINQLVAIFLRNKFIE